MASIPTTVVKMNGSNVQSVNLPLPSAGANFTSGWQSSSLNKCVELKNIIPSDLCLKPSGSFVPLGENRLWENSFHSITQRPYCSKMLIHAGSRIYCFTPSENTAVILYEGVPDSQSMFCEFASKLYLYSNGRVFSVDRNFNVTEELPKAPVIIKEVENDSGGLGKKVSQPDLNLIAPRVGISYSKASCTAFVLPSDYKCNTEMPIKVYADGVEKKVSVSKSSESRIIITSEADFEQAVVEIYLKDPGSVSFDGFFSTCTKSISFGGASAGGTRIIAGASSDSERLGEYCTSALADPLYFPLSTLEKAGDGCDRITGFVKSDGCLIVFTDRSVYKTEYSITSEGGLFSMHQINDSIGSDMPESICLAGSNVVFANSEKGVFAVDVSDETGTYNVFPVSSNINDGDDGLLSCDKDELKNANSVDFDGRYMLCVGRKIYVWDYSRCGFVRSADYEKSRGRLIWYVFETEPGQILLNLGRELYCVDKGCGMICRYSADSDMTRQHEDDEYRLTTEEYRFGSAMERKLITEVYMSLKMPKFGKVKLSLLRDGEVYFTTYLSSQTDKKTHFRIKPPQVPLCGFSYSLTAQNVPFELWGASVKLRTAE